eukprot:g6500.t1
MKTTAAATARTSTTGSHSQLASMSSTTSTEIAASGTLFSPHKQFLDANNLPMLQSNYKSFQLHGMNLNENNRTSAVDVVPAATMTTTTTTRSSAHSNVAVAGVGNKNRYTEKELVQDLERPCGSGYTSYPAVVTDACCHQTDMFAWGRSPARGMFGGAERDHVKNSTNGDGNISRAEKSEREQDQEDEGAFASPLSANLNLAIFRCDRTRKIGGGRRKHQLGSSLNLLCKREADVIGNARELDSSVANVPAAGFLASEGSSYSYNSTSTCRRSSLGGESMRELLRHDEVAVPAESGSHDPAGTMKAKQGGTKMGLRRGELENNAVLVLPVSPTCKGKQGGRAFEDREEVNERRQRFASTTQRAECGRKSWRSSQKNPKMTETRATKPKAHPGFYKVGIELAQGSEGDVFAAVQIPADRQVALKRIAINGPKVRCTKKHAWTELCVAEAVFLGMTAQDHEVELKRLKRWESAPPHPYIVQTMDFFAGFDGIDRELFLVSERCLFGLDDLIRGSRFSEIEIRKVFLQMLEALAFLNKLGFLHRDVKAENILWAPAGNYKLCDFGVSVRVPMTAGGSSTSSEVLAAAAAGGPGGMLGPSTGRAGASRDYAGSPAGGIAATDPMKRVQQSSTGLYSPSSPLLEQMGRQSVCSPFSPGDDVLNMRDLIDRVPDTPFDEGAPASNGTSPTSPDAAEDGQHRVSVTDLNPRLTVGLKNRANCGTLWTMSPELLRPKIHDASTDIWSLAIVLYEMCYLDKPYNSMELLAYQNDNSLDALPVVLQLANGMSGLSLGVPAMLAGGSATVQLPTGITSPAVVEAANSAAVGASSSKGANAKRVRPGTTGGSTTSTGANSNASSSPVVGRLSTGSSAASPTLHRKGSATGLGLGATTATPGGGTSGAANSNSSTQKAKPTWLKWFYSKDLKKLLVAMLNSNRKERPTPLELKGATPATCTTATGEHLDWYASLVKPIVEKPPTYATLTSSSSSAASKSATSGTSSSGANPRERRPSTPSSPAIKGAQQHLQGGGGNRDTPATGAGASTPPVKKGSSVEEIEQVLLTAEKFCFNLLENANSARRSCHPLPPTNDLSPIALAKHKTAVVAREEKKLKSAAASAGSSVEEPGAPRVEEARSGRGAPGTRKNNESSLSLSPPKRNSRQKEKQTNGHEPQQVVDNVGQSEPLSDGEEQPSSYVQHAVVAHQTTAQTIQEQPPLRNITQNSIADHIEARLRAQNATAELLQQVASLEQACVKAANANHKVGAASTISKSRASNAIRIPGAGLLPPMPIEEDIIARDGAETSTTAEQIPNIKKECQETELPRTSPVPGIGIASESRIPGTRATACNDVDEAELLDHAERYDSNSYGGEHQQAAPFVEDDLELCSPGLLDDPDAAWRASMPPLLDRGKSNLSSWDNNIQTDFNAGRTFPDEAGRGGEIMTTPSYSLSGLSSQRAAGGGGGSATGATGSRLTSAAGSSVPLVASGATPTGTATVAGVASPRRSRSSRRYSEYFPLPADGASQPFVAEDDAVFWLPVPSERCRQEKQKEKPNESECWERFREASFLERFTPRIKRQIKRVRAVHLWDHDVQLQEAAPSVADEMEMNKSQTIAIPHGHQHPPLPVLEKIASNTVASIDLRERNAHLGLVGMLLDLRHTVLAVRMENGGEILVDKNADTGVWCRKLARDELLYLWRKYAYSEAVERCARAEQLQQTEHQTKGEDHWDDHLLAAAATGAFSEPMDRSNCQHFCSELLQKLFLDKWLNLELEPLGHAVSAEVVHNAVRLSYGAISRVVRNAWLNQGYYTPIPIMTKTEATESATSMTSNNSAFSGGANLFYDLVFSGLRSSQQQLSGLTLRTGIGTDSAGTSRGKMTVSMHDIYRIRYLDAGRAGPSSGVVSRNTRTPLFPLRNQRCADFLQKYGYLDDQFKTEPDPYAFVTKGLLSWWCKTKVISLWPLPWIRTFHLVRDPLLPEAEKRRSTP